MQAEHKQNASAAPDAPAHATKPGPDAKREQSSILFPYGDLDTAIEVARTIHEVGGQSCENDQLAGKLGISPTGGNFRARIAPARIFGLMNLERGEVSLTPLGLRMVDRTQEAAARVEAFLQVPLYAAVYEKYKGYQLPGAAALEGEMVKLGVSSKQKDKARQVFERSARQANFFWAGKDRLVKPKVTAGEGAGPETMEQEAADRPPASVERDQTSGSRRGGSNGGGGGYHLLIEGLLSTLPEQGTLWTIEGRAAWLQAAAHNFTLIYKGEGNIEVQVAQSKKVPQEH